MKCTRVSITYEATLEKKSTGTLRADIKHRERSGEKVLAYNTYNIQTIESKKIS